MKISEIEATILRKRASGQCCNMRWRFVCEGQNVTKHVEKLKRAGLLTTTFFERDSATTNATELGEQALADYLGTVQ